MSRVRRVPMHPRRRTIQRPRSTQSPAHPSGGSAPHPASAPSTSCPCQTRAGFSVTPSMSPHRSRRQRLHFRSASGSSMQARRSSSAAGPRSSRPPPPAHAACASTSGVICARWRQHQHAIAHAFRHLAAALHMNAPIRSHAGVVQQNVGIHVVVVVSRGRRRLQPAPQNGIVDGAPSGSRYARSATGLPCCSM